MAGATKEMLFSQKEGKEKQQPTGDTNRLSLQATDVNYEHQEEGFLFTERGK